ncbi:hypothetical protein [Methylomagnum ishizawai]|uniref:hypothetical protein n=1 Tax=Methylomagnum ishizawai TaxID=1760988 RepID=UPI001C326DEA|nr:hypothetical protein [Methylomagnum ishizawai]BBL74145.1 hypothetical protein MishRS11D_12430 [Methylomagnum ishizawai]
MARKHSASTDTEATGTTPETVETTTETTETVALSEAVEITTDTVTVSEAVETPEAAGIMESEAAPAQTTALEVTQAPSEGLSEAIREGASDARAAVVSLKGFVRKGVYTGFYYATYGVVFGALMVGSLIPSNNAMGEGVRDGFKAAQKDFETGKHAEEGLAEAGLAAA